MRGVPRDRWEGGTVIAGCCLIVGLVLATAPAWRLLVFDAAPPIEALLGLRCAPLDPPG